MNAVIAKFKQGWERFWFQPEPPEALGVCRALFFGMLLYQYGRVDFTVYANLGRFFWDTQPLFSLFFRHGPPSFALVAWTQVAWKISLATSLLGLFTRFSTAIACILGLFFLSFPYNFGKLDHQMASSGVALLVMAFSHCGHTWSLDRIIARRGGKVPVALSGAEARWPIQMMRVVLCLVLFCAGGHKLRSSGLDWVWSETLQMNLLIAGAPLGLWAAQWPGLCHFLAGATIVIEFFQPLSLVSKKFAVILVPAGLGLFVGIYLMMNISFFSVAFLHIFWLPWNRIFYRSQTPWFQQGKQVNRRHG